MNDRGRVRGQGTVGLRLALTFIAVAVLAVALVAVLAVLFTDRDIAVLVQQRRDDLTNALAADAVSTYNTGKPGWYDVDLAPALKLADSDGAQAAVLDAKGRVVASTLTRTGDSSGIVSRELTSGGQRIGTLLVRFTGQGLTAAVYNLRASLVRAVIGAAGLAAVLALLAAVLVSRRITRPVTRLIESVRAMGRGDEQARVGPVAGAPAELRELAVAFDQMADTLTAHEQVRRNLVADVAHELRTPVAVLQANTEALHRRAGGAYSRADRVAARRGATAGADGGGPADPGRRRGGCPATGAAAVRPGRDRGGGGRGMGRQLRGRRGRLRPPV